MTDVAGFCPMGCGQTLSVMSGGHVTCRKLECPRPDAVSEILDDPETEHVVQLGEDTFTVRHPLRERLDNALMTCQLHGYIASLDRPPAAPGMYRVLNFDGGRDWVFDPIADRGGVR